MTSHKKFRGSRRPNKMPNRAVLTHKQIQDVIEAACATPGMQIAANIITVLAHTGLRAGELVRLRVSDYDDAKSTLRIVSDKSAYARFVPLDSAAREALNVLSSHCGDSEYLLGCQGELRMRRVSIQIREVAKQLGIASFHLHDLRRSFAMSLLKTGMSVVTIGHILGLRNLYVASHLCLAEKGTLV